MAILIELINFFPSGVIFSLGRVIPLLIDFHFVYFSILPMPFSHKEISLLGLVAQIENSQYLLTCMFESVLGIPSPLPRGFFLPLFSCKVSQVTALDLLTLTASQNKEPHAAIWVL